MNRQTVLNYSNSDPTVSTTYDGSACLGLSACQNIGHATSITDAAGSESWAYQTDSSNLRSVHVNQRTTNSVTKTSIYYFDLAANLTSITYPTGRVVNYTYDAANRPATAADSANGITYAAAQSTPPSGCLSSGVCYTPQGTDYSAAIGKTSGFAGVNFSETYNSRLQPLEIKASSTAGSAIDITYSFVDSTSGGNAGHVNSIANNLNSSRSQSFSYDSLNRIVTAGTTATSGTYCWGYQYGYDAWANLLYQQGWSPNYNGCSEATMGSVTADGNNHISGFSYDASGNTQNDGTIAYTYDAESQIKTAAGVTYTYDGSGRRVSKSSGKLYWYGSGGEILAETDAWGSTSAEYVYFGGKRIAMLPGNSVPNSGFEQGTTGWNTSGTASVITDATRAHSGSNYMQLTTTTTTTTAEAISPTCIAVVPGQQITFGGWAYVESGSTSAVSWDLVAADANCSALAYPGAGPQISSTGVWTYQVATYTVPSNVAFVRLYCLIWNSSAPTVARFDDGFVNFGSYGGGTPQYYVEDLLGTSRLITTNNGTVCYDADFDPYGGEHAYTNTCSQNYKFEGKERDTETGNDDFGARYYTSRFGRWLSADWSSVPVPVPYANLTNPQTLNLYSMVADDPESFADLDGHVSNASMGLNEAGCAEAGGGSNTDGSCARERKNPTWSETENQQQAEAAQQRAQNQNQQDQNQQNQQSPCAQYGCGGGTPKKSDFVLPPDPTGLGPEWTKDPRHKNPNGEKWVNPDGDVLEWHRGKPGEPSFQGKDHWHWRPGGRKLGDHRLPGETIKTYGPAVAKTGVVAVFIYVAIKFLEAAALAF